MEESVTEIEINGAKFLVDLRNAKRIDTFKVGDKVKVLKKKWGETWETYPGVIAGFDAFVNRPTVIVAYIDGAKALEFEYINKDSKDVEICASHDTDLPLKKADVIRRMESEIAAKEKEIRDIRDRLNYFNEMFGQYFPEVPAEEAETA